jgi:hypothetical protein
MIPIFNIPVYWVSLLVFFPALVIVTECAKRHVVWPGIYVAWGTGAVLFPIMALAFHVPVNIPAVVEFMALTFIITKSYDPFKPAIQDFVDLMKSIKEKLGNHFGGGDGMPPFGR